MKLTHQTATATLIQFVTMVMLGFPNALVSIITTCNNDSSNCVSNMITTIIYYMITVFWFAIILLVGYFAQKNRSNRLAILLILLEIPTIIAAGLINFPREGNWLAKGTSLLDVLLGTFVIYLAVQLLFARGQRIVKGSRRRKSNA